MCSASGGTYPKSAAAFASGFDLLFTVWHFLSMVHRCPPSYENYPDKEHGGGSHPSVAVVIIGRNGAAFLPACLDSVLCQSHPADEVVYVDDASSDDSVRVARRFGPGVRIIERTEQGGMCAARNTGAEATESTLLLFVDCDNTLPPDYLQTMMEDLGEHAFVYPSKRFVTRGGSLEQDLVTRHHPTSIWTPPAADRAQLWQANYADTCSLIRRSVLLAAGGWIKREIDTWADWDLFLRASRLGTHARSRAVLHYRVHPGNNSRQPVHAANSERYRVIRRAAAKLSVATVYSGRLPALWLEWLRAVRASIRNAGTTAELILLDASPAGNIGADRSLGDWDGVQVHRLPGVDAVTRRQDRRATAEFLAAAFNAALDASRGDVLWCVEDDTIPPLNACEDMLNHLLGQPIIKTAVGGCYRSRHQPENWLAAHFDGRSVMHLQELPAEPFPVQLTGTGCLMLLKDRLRGLRWKAEWHSHGRRSPAHDWTLSHALHQREDPVWLLPSVICRHHITAEDYV